MARCERDYCGGLIISDGERNFCLSCNRSPTTPEPLPLIPKRKKWLIMSIAELTEADKVRRKRRSVYMNERRHREKARCEALAARH